LPTVYRPKLGMSDRFSVQFFLPKFLFDRKNCLSFSKIFYSQILFYLLQH
jgi:hypothetical protein